MIAKCVFTFYFQVSTTALPAFVVRLWTILLRSFRAHPSAPGWFSGQELFAREEEEEEEFSGRMPCRESPF